MKKHLHIENSKGIFEKNYNDKLDEAISKSGLAEKMTLETLKKMHQITMKNQEKG